MYNDACGSFIGGGCCNLVDVTNCISSIVGGFKNTFSVYSHCSFIGGGTLNDMSCACSSTIVGGASNCIGASFSSIAGGKFNQICGLYSFIGSGCENCITNFCGTGSAGYYCVNAGVIAGGLRNYINHCITSSAAYNSGIFGGNAIGGGICNYVGMTISGSYQSSGYTTISGGYCNTAGLKNGGPDELRVQGITIGGGYSNCAVGNFLTIGGGFCNCVAGDYSTIGGGSYNTAICNSSTVGGGQCNKSCNDSSTVSGGVFNTASGCNSSILGGRCNVASAEGSAVLAGFYNCACACYSVASGAGAFSYLYGQSSSFSGYNVFGGISPVIAQSSKITAWGNGSLNSTTIRQILLYLDGDGSRAGSTIIPNGSNRAWNVTVNWIAAVKSLGVGTTGGLAVGDVITGTDAFFFKKVAGVSSISSINPLDLNSDASMSSATITYNVGASEDLQILFTAPTTAGNGTTAPTRTYFRVMATIQLTEVNW